MAGKWRIRHKLLLGLGMVAGIIALLLAGTSLGLHSYVRTAKSIDSKLGELQEADKLWSAVRALEDHKIPNANWLDQKVALYQRLDEADQALAGYEIKLRDTLTRRRDPDQGNEELGQVGALRRTLRQLRETVEAVYNASGKTVDHPLKEHPDVKAKIRALLATTDDLRSVIYGDVGRRITEAKAHSRYSLIGVITVAVLGLGLSAGLFRFFYRWVVYPVRDLEVGAGRAAQGDFGHRIEVHSGDEMEDLAKAFNDMTSRLNATYKDLNHQVNERSRQLVRSERLASVGFLAAGVAHEINNPLASIAFCSEALESRLQETLARAPRDGEVIRKYLRMIQQEAFRCKAITGRLLELSRDGERSREMTDLAGIVQNVLDIVQHLQNSRGKSIVFQPAGPVRAWVNAQEIKSVVLNLVVNALDSMDEGGTLTILLGTRDGKAELLFADTGCGMTSEVLENLFEPFFTRSRTGKGTGLGLSISHRIVTQHGGEIEAASPGPRRGSTFKVRLPTQPAESVREDGFGQAA